LYTGEELAVEESAERELHSIRSDLTDAVGQAQRRRNLLRRVVVMLLLFTAPAACLVFALH
jgi:hypothetical protein